MRTLGLLATAAVLALAGTTASRAESVIVQEPAPVMAPGQQIITERTIEPGLFGDQFVRERTIVTQPMMAEPTIVAPAPRARTTTVRRYVEPRFAVTQRAPVYQPGVTTVVTEPSATVVTEPAYRPAYWGSYEPGYVTTAQDCTIGFDGIRRCY